MQAIKTALCAVALTGLLLVVGACGNNSGSGGATDHPTNIPGMGGPTMAIPTDGPAKTGGTDIGPVTSGTTPSTAP